MSIEMQSQGAVWLQVTAGRGPAECQLAVGLLLPVITAEARAQGLKAEVIGAEPGGGRDLVLSGLIKIEGAEATAFGQRWHGSVQWICSSPVRPGHKRRNWFIGVTVLQVPDAAQTDKIAPRGVEFEAMRASGPGGQHVNKTESAVRATHRPTGLIVVAREERSQAMNRRLALARLALAVRERAEDVAAESRQQRWTSHDQLERGNPVRVFEGSDFRERKRRG